MSLIIVEGPDGSGKTTLINRARHEGKRYFWAVRPSGPPKTYDDLYEAAKWISLGSNRGMTIVCDRHPYISEPIYGPILRGRSLIPATARVNLVCQLFEQDTQLIYCRPPLDIIIENATKSHQLDGVIAKLPAIVAAYDESIKEIAKLAGHIMEYDYGDPNVIGLWRVFGEAP